MEVESTYHRPLNPVPRTSLRPPRPGSSFSDIPPRAQRLFPRCFRRWPREHRGESHNIGVGPPTISAPWPLSCNVYHWDARVQYCAGHVRHVHVSDERGGDCPGGRGQCGGAAQGGGYICCSSSCRSWRATPTWPTASSTSCPCPCSPAGTSGSWRPPSHDTRLLATCPVTRAWCPPPPGHCAHCWWSWSRSPSPPRPPPR